MISLSLDDDLGSLVLVKEAPLWSLDWPQPGDHDDDDEDDHDDDGDDEGD